MEPEEDQPHINGWEPVGEVRGHPAQDHLPVQNGVEVALPPIVNGFEPAHLPQVNGHEPAHPPLVNNGHRQAPLFIVNGHGQALAPIINGFEEEEDEDEDNEEEVLEIIYNENESSSQDEEDQRRDIAAVLGDEAAQPVGDSNRSSSSSSDENNPIYDRTTSEDENEESPERAISDDAQDGNDEGRWVRRVFAENPAQRLIREGTAPPQHLLRISAAEASIEDHTNEFHRQVELLYNQMREEVQQEVNQQVDEFSPQHELVSTWYAKTKEEMNLLRDNNQEVIAQFMQEHPSLRPQGSRRGRIQDFLFVNPLKQLGWVEVENLRNALGEIEVPPIGSPFLGHQLCLHPFTLYTNRNNEAREIWKAAREFLTRNGSHVHYLTLELENSPNSIYKVNAATFIFQHLPRLAPNLRRLAVKFCFGLQMPPEVGPNQPIVSTLETMEIRCQFPRPHECQTCNRSTVIVRLLNVYHLQLRKLRITSKIWSQSAKTLAWPVLEELCVEDIMDGFDFEDLRPCANLPKLEMLEINGTVADHENVGTCLAVLREVITNSPMISTLALEGIYLEELEWNLDNVFPIKLKTLMIDLGNRQITSFMFLITRFLAIENVQIYSAKPQSGDANATGVSLYTNTEREIVRYFEGPERFDSDRILHLNRHMRRGDMYACKIWEWLPNLQFFSFQFGKFSRQEYNQFIA